MDIISDSPHDDQPVLWLLRDADGNITWRTTTEVDESSVIDEAQAEVDRLQAVEAQRKSNARRES